MQRARGCGTGQSGRVFFLVGTSSSGTATRDGCTVPAGKALFFPLVNAFDVHTPGDGLDTPLLVWNDLQNTIGFGPFSELHATIDGVPVGNLNPARTPFRACAGPVARCSAAAADCHGLGGGRGDARSAASAQRRRESIPVAT